MSTYVGRSGNKLHYADIRHGIFSVRGVHVTVTMFDRGEPIVLMEDLGKVMDKRHAIEKVAVIVKRQQALFERLKEMFDV